MKSNRSDRELVLKAIRGYKAEVDSSFYEIMRKVQVMIPDECELTEDAILSYCADVEKIYNDTMIDYFSETLAEEVVWILKKRMEKNT